MTDNYDGRPAILRSVAAPPRLLYADPELVKLEAAAAIVLGLLLQEPMAAIVLFVSLHGLAMVLTARDPHFSAVMRAKLRCRRTRNLRPIVSNRYVP
jgi:type IV secretory pathway TrbD component